MSSLEFQINLSGNFASALSEAGGELGKTEGQTKKAQESLENFDKELHRVEEQLKRIKANPEQFAELMKAQHELNEATKEGREGAEGFRHKLFEWVEIGKEAYEVIEGLVDKVVDLGKEMVETAGKTQDLNLAVKLDVGEEGLEKVNELTESFKGTRFAPAELKKALLPILEESGDEHNEQWDDLVTAATDVATRRDTGASGAVSALEALRSIEIMPQKVRGALKELGIKQKDFYSDLGDLLGISESAAEKEVKAGKIKADTLLNVALHQIAEREGGALGNATNEGSKTLGASLERLAHLKENLFEGIADSPGMQAIQGFLDNFITTMEGPIGQDLVAKISSAFETLFGDLSGPEGLQKLGAEIGDVAHGVESMIDSFKEAWPAIKDGAGDVWTVLKGIGETVGLIVKGWAEIIKLAHEADSGKLYQDTGEALLGVHAEATGNTPKNMTWDESIQGYRPGAPEVPADIPAFAAGGIVSGPTLALIGESGPEAVIPLRGDGGARGALNALAFGGGDERSSGHVITIGDIIVHVAGGNNPQESGQLSGEAVREELKKFIQEIAA